MRARLRHTDLLGVDSGYFNVTCGHPGCHDFIDAHGGVTRKPIKKAVSKFKSQDWTGSKDRMFCPEHGKK